MIRGSRRSNPYFLFYFVFKKNKIEGLEENKFGPNPNLSHDNQPNFSKEPSWHPTCSEAS